MDIGIHQRNTLIGGEDIVQFGGIRLQELPTGRDVIKEVLNTEITTHRAGHRLLVNHLRTGNGKLGSNLVSRHTGL